MKKGLILSVSHDDYIFGEIRTVRYDFYSDGTYHTTFEDGSEYDMYWRYANGEMLFSNEYGERWKPFDNNAISDKLKSELDKIDGILVGHLQ